MQTNILFCKTQMLDLSLHPPAHLYTTTIELIELCSVQLDYVSKVEYETGKTHAFITWAKMTDI